MKIIKFFLSLVIGSELVFNYLKKRYNRSYFPFIHVVTYHDTPHSSLEEFRKHLEWYSKNYINCNYKNLILFLNKKTWKYSKPGLIISFDDGLRSNYDFAIPLLEEFGFTGWFMIPPSFIDQKETYQEKFAKERLIDYSQLYSDGRIAMDWDELRDINLRGHVITCHSMNHTRLSEKLDNKELRNEIIDSKLRFKDELGINIDIFTWVGGEEWTYSKNAFKLMVNNENYNMIFCTNCAPILSNQNPFFLERYHIDSHYPINMLRFILGGFYDQLYLFKRKRIYKKLFFQNNIY